MWGYEELLRYIVLAFSMSWLTGCNLTSTKRFFLLIRVCLSFFVLIFEESQAQNVLDIKIVPISLSFAIINLDLFLFVIVLGKVSPCNILADIGLFVELKQTNVNFCASDHTSCQCLVEIQSGVYPGKRICLTWKPRWSFKIILSLSTSWKEKFILKANLYFTPLIPNQNQNFTQLNNLVKSSRTLREHFKMVR